MTLGRQQSIGSGFESLAAHAKRVPERNRSAEKQQVGSVGLKINNVSRQG